MELATPGVELPAVPRVAGAVHRLVRTQRVARPRRDVFAFFAAPENLEAITPDTLRFEIRTPRPIPMRAGAVIEYRLRLVGVGFRWITRIDVFEPEERFVDVQLRGPYRLWRHTHEFFDVPGGTLVRDTVDYDVGRGPVGELARVLFVGRQLERIFDHRRTRIEELLSP